VTRRTGESGEWDLDTEALSVDGAGQFGIDEENGTRDVVELWGLEG
jgi:hypothetical protein